MAYDFSELAISSRVDSMDFLFIVGTATNCPAMLRYSSPTGQGGPRIRSLWLAPSVQPACMLLRGPSSTRNLLASSVAGGGRVGRGAAAAAARAGAAAATGAGGRALVVGSAALVPIESAAGGDHGGAVDGGEAGHGRRGGARGSGPVAGLVAREGHRVPDGVRGAAAIADSRSRNLADVLLLQAPTTRVSSHVMCVQCAPSGRQQAATSDPSYSSSRVLLQRADASCHVKGKGEEAQDKLSPEQPPQPWWMCQPE